MTYKRGREVHTLPAESVPKDPCDREDCTLLRNAINESGDCLPGCDSYGHEEACPNINMLTVLRDQQKEIERLRGSRTSKTRLSLLEDAWLKYGRHGVDCQRYGPHQCTCGFVETWAELERATDDSSDARET